MDDLKQIFASFTAWKATDNTWFINFMNGSQYLYLLEGDEKALLIDTGYGAGNLRAFVETLTSKQIIAANTHFHPDHSAGNGEFEQVYLSRGATIDEPSVLTPGAVPFALAELPYPDYERIYVGEGDTIDLGNRVIEVLDVKPAHCNSSLFFLDRTYRMMFCGDEMESTQVLMYDNSCNPAASYDVAERLANFRLNNIRLKELAGAYDLLLPCHNGAPLAKSYVDEYIGLVDAVYNGTAVIEDNLNHPFIERDPKAPELCRVRYKKASIFIKKKELLTVFGTASE